MHALVENFEHFGIVLYIFLSYVHGIASPSKSMHILIQEFEAFGIVHYI